MKLTTRDLSGERLWVALYHAATFDQENYQPLSKDESLKITRQEGYIDGLMAKSHLKVIPSPNKKHYFVCANPDAPDVEPFEGIDEKVAFSRALIHRAFGDQINYPFLKTNYFNKPEVDDINVNETTEVDGAEDDA